MAASLLARTLVSLPPTPVCSKYPTSASVFTATWPVVSVVDPRIAPSTVLFPAPFGPTMPQRSPGMIVHVAPETSSTGPLRTERSSSTNAAPPVSPYWMFAAWRRVVAALRSRAGCSATAAANTTLSINERVIALLQRSNRQAVAAVCSR